MVTKINDNTSGGLLLAILGDDGTFEIHKVCRKIGLNVFPTCIFKNNPSSSTLSNGGVFSLHIHLHVKDSNFVFIISTIVAFNFY